VQLNDVLRCPTSFSPVEGLPLLFREIGWIPEPVSAPWERENIPAPYREYKFAADGHYVLITVLTKLGILAD
jgi:hypothetical protein